MRHGHDVVVVVSDLVRQNEAQAEEAAHEEVFRVLDPLGRGLLVAVQLNVVASGDVAARMPQPIRLLHEVQTLLHVVVQLVFPEALWLKHGDVRAVSHDHWLGVAAKFLKGGNFPDPPLTGLEVVDSLTILRIAEVSVQAENFLGRFRYLHVVFRVGEVLAQPLLLCF